MLFIFVVLVNSCVLSQQWWLLFMASFICKQIFIIENVTTFIALNLLMYLHWSSDLSFFIYQDIWRDLKINAIVSEQTIPSVWKKHNILNNNWNLIFLFCIYVSKKCWQLLCKCCIEMLLQVTWWKDDERSRATSVFIYLCTMFVAFDTSMSWNDLF